MVDHKWRAKRIRVNPEEATVVRIIFALHGQGRHAGQIADTLNAGGYRRRNGARWVPQLVRKILRRRELCAEEIVRYGDAAGRNPELVLLKEK